MMNLLSTSNVHNVKNCEKTQVACLTLGTNTSSGN
jgi:hypothetical protein